MLCTFIWFPLWHSQLRSKPDLLWPPAGLEQWLCCLETIITIAVCTVYVGGAIGTQVFYPKITIIIIIIKITIKDKKELIHCHMNTHNHMNKNHVLCTYVYLERVVDPSCCCCFYTCLVGFGVYTRIDGAKACCHLLYP